MDLRSIDPGACKVRHIVRASAGDEGAQQLGRVYFASAAILTGADGLNGRTGWQQADTTLVLSDDGSFTLTLPNVAGADGVLHRRRFAALTDPDYEPGEEWLEFWSDFDSERPFFVGTPTDYEKTKSTVTLKGADLTSVLAGALSSEVDAWDSTAPADVFGHYSRVPVLVLADEPGTVDTFTTGAEAYTVALAGVSSDCWTAEARVRWLGQSDPLNAGLDLFVGDFDIFDTSYPNNCVVTAINTGRGTVQFGRIVDGGSQIVTNAATDRVVAPAGIVIRFVARYDHLFLFINGTLSCELRRAKPWEDVIKLSVAVANGTVAVDAVQVETLAPFAMRGASAVAERRLPGIPPAEGLRARYWNAAPAFDRWPDGIFSYARYRAAMMFPVAGSDPVAERLEETIDHADTAPNIASAWVARWSGAIYLDLAAADRELRLTALEGRARLYVGRTLRGDEAANSWNDETLGAPPATITTGALRAWLGESESGWYPIVIECLHAAQSRSIKLEDTALDGGGAPIAWAVVPTARLSPIGVYEDLVRSTPARTVIGDVSQAFGYQWRALPRSLESGEFPGALEFRSLVGRQTSLVIDDDQLGSEVTVQGAAGDVVDGLVADAAGIANPDSGQLSVQVVDYSRARGHFALRQSYESLSEITEPPLLRTRADSLLALRSSPNEQVGVRPRGQIDLVENFELTGDLAKMRWEPGDGVRLELESVDVADASPRQLVSVSWAPRPDGLGGPTVSFRQRPRSPAAALKRLRAAIFGPRRTYQGSLAPVTGSPGGTSGTTDNYSRLTLPTNPADLVRVFAVIQSISGTWRLEVNGTDEGSNTDMSAPGRYDITQFVAAAGTGQPYVYARLIGGTGSYLMTLEAIVRI